MIRVSDMIGATQCHHLQRSALDVEKTHAKQMDVADTPNSSIRSDEGKRVVHVFHIYIYLIYIYIDILYYTRFSFYPLYIFS